MEIFGSDFFIYGFCLLVRGAVRPVTVTVVVICVGLNLVGESREGGGVRPHLASVLWGVCFFFFLK